MSNPFPALRIKAQAQALGFNLVGLTPAAPAPHLDAYLRWIDAGYHAELGYLARPDRVTRRRDLNVILPGVRSLVIVGLDYHNALPPALRDDPTRGRIAAYALGTDYHPLMLERLRALAGWLAAECAGEVRHRAYVDTGAILERSHGYAAGLGFVGKNTLLIHPRRGSNFFLGELLTDAVFDAYDQPGPASRCGTCTRCLAACPTQAFPSPYVLDAGRCLSYLTIEHAGWIPPELRPHQGRWVFGCDICQEVCPWQRFAVTTQEAAFLPVAAGRAAPRLADLLALTPEAFDARFAGTALHRTGRDRLVRNACVAAGNAGQPGLIPRLAHLLVNDPNPLVRGHAAWALGRLPGAAAAPLQAALEREAVVEVRREIAAALA